MAAEDKRLKCVTCGEEFIFFASEQDRFQRLGYTNEPRHCPTCREVRKVRPEEERPSRTLTRRPQTRGRRPAVPRRATAPVIGRKEMHDVVCSACGKQTQVPFKPRTDRPVYCADCYKNQGK